jgi:hypothetical protein
VTRRYPRLTYGGHEIGTVFSLGLTRGRADVWLVGYGSARVPVSKVVGPPGSPLTAADVLEQLRRRAGVVFGEGAAEPKSGAGAVFEVGYQTEEQG